VTLAQAIQEMVDNSQIVGGLVVTGDHEANGYIVLDWDPLGRRGVYLEEVIRRSDDTR